ncbi:MAG: TIGR00725 family protein [Ardenticatenaceae bacterium]|nr:TIGR00725 family protein [Anaerolineales bacterium]MCB8937320.1 TIGR00725 family protein [Ardenticatenaceae bacterium]MCB8975486.1 TIGR00725 family protein [Ardenticatenaceae bacterium]
MLHPIEQKYIGVIGSSSNVPEDVYEAAVEVGRLIAEAGCILVTGGGSGIMEAASRGAKLAGGLVVGILPEGDRRGANAYIDVAIPTGVGYALRNITTIRSCDSVIMIRGSSGTLNEVTQAYAHGKPLTVLQGTGGFADRLEAILPIPGYLDERKSVEIEFVNSTREAVRRAVERIGTVQPPQLGLTYELVRDQ